MKYDRRAIMKRAWEIKKDTDSRTLDFVRCCFPATKELKPEQKAIFGECLKLAWNEFRRADELAAKLNITMVNALRLAAKEHLIHLDHGYDVVWKLWSGYGFKRAYFKASGWSKYANSKKYNFVELV